MKADTVSTPSFDKIGLPRDDGLWFVRDDGREGWRSGELPIRGRTMTCVPNGVQLAALPLAGFVRAEVWRDGTIVWAADLSSLREDADAIRLVQAIGEMFDKAKRPAP